MSENTEKNSSNALVVTSNECTNTPIGLTKSASSTICDKDNAPRILCNELIVDPHACKSSEKLDELSSLEREIAKMHHVDDVNIGSDGSSNMQGEIKKDQVKTSHILTVLTADSGVNANVINSNNDLGCQNTNMEAKLDAITSGETALEHEDLIAVLKGLDSTADETLNNSGSRSILEGVTIEGEGEYQIMEVVDEDSNATEDPAKQDDGVASTSDPTAQSLNKTKTFGSIGLTAQEERALALEQMEGLKVPQRRRKQNIKPIKQIDPVLDLVSALEADWSEHEEETIENSKSEAKTKQLSNKNKAIATTISDSNPNSPLITNVVPSATASISNTIKPPITSTAKSDVNANVSSNSEEIKVLKSSPIDGVIETKMEDTQAVSSQSGFRRTRIIKRKIIWDPDAPETTFSYANLVKPNNNTKTKREQILTTSIKKGSTIITPLKKETLASTSLTTAKKAQRPTTPKAKKQAIESNIEKTSSVRLENSGLLKNNVEKEATKLQNKAEDVHAKTPPSLEVKSSPTNSPTKRRSQTPVSNGSGCAVGVKKKKITEIDRLMGDEGAVNMLNSLEKLEATLGTGEAKPTRPMMRSRAATICEKLPRKDTISPIRSTATTPPTVTNPQTNKGKRATKSRASSSWDYVYKKKKQDFDDSLIIRRRSNSSYSSTTSQNRLSLDGPPAAITNNNTSNTSLQSTDPISLPASTKESDLSKSPASTSNQNKGSSGSKARTTPTPPAIKTFEFAKPENKKTQKSTKTPSATLTNDMKKAAPVASKRNDRSPSTTNEDKGKDVIKTPSTKSPVNIKDKKDAAPSSSTISDVVVKKTAKVAQILFSTNKAKLSNTFTIQMLNKLVDILDKLASDPDCHVVVMGTNDAHFCQGIDITDLTTIAAEKRRNYAVNLASSVKNYLKTLATYPKPLIAGVNGNLMNLGVIQLALFDVVIASEKCTFEMPYLKMGQTPEGFCIWHNMNKIRGSFKTKLFWLCEKVQSTEAALAGLVNKLTAANKVNDDALVTAKRIASLSSDSYRVMKKTVIKSHLDVIANSLDEEFNTIIKQWTSSECLENLRKYIGHD